MKLGSVRDICMYGILTLTLWLASPLYTLLHEVAHCQAFGWVSGNHRSKALIAYEDYDEDLDAVDPGGVMVGKGFWYLSFGLHRAKCVFPPEVAPHHLTDPQNGFVFFWGPMFALLIWMLALWLLLAGWYFLDDSGLSPSLSPEWRQRRCVDTKCHRVLWGLWFGFVHVWGLFGLISHARLTIGAKLAGLVAALVQYCAQLFGVFLGLLPPSPMVLSVANLN